MKKKYELYNGLIISSLLFGLLILFFTIFLFRQKIVLYKSFNAVVYQENILVLVLNDDDVKIFHKNKSLFIKNRKMSFEIERIEKNILKKDKVKYNQVFINIKLPNSYKVNDVVNVSIMKKTMASYNIFRIIWGGVID